MNELKKDTFTECLVKIERTKKINTLIILIWTVFILLGLGLALVGYLVSVVALLMFPLCIVCLYLAYFLTSRLNAEFEYINTNGEIDIDRIINGKKRQTMASFECNSIDNVERYNPERHKASVEKRIYHACTPGNDSYAITVRHPKGGVYTVVITPDEDFKESLKSYLPYNLKKLI